jgi:hypothetical protein
MSRTSPQTGSVIESLEPRQLLSADLGVINVDVTPDVAAPGGSVVVSWLVRNLGTEAMSGQWKDTVYFSNDNVLNPATDQVIYSQTVNVATLAPAVGYGGQRQVQLPAVQNGGTYYIFVATDTNNEQNESNEGNNVMSMPITVDLTAGRFGSSDGERYGVAEVADGNGVPVRFILGGGGWGEIIGSGDDMQVVLHDTTPRSVLRIFPRGGRGVTTSLADIQVSGPINAIIAPKVAITDEISVDESANRIVIGDLDTAAINVSDPGRRGTVIVAGDVVDSQINLVGGTPLVRVQSWTDSDPGADISAAWMNRIVSLGDFQADVGLTGVDAGRFTLNRGVFRGVVSESTFNVVGSGRAMIFQSDADADLNFTGVLLNTSSRGTLSGVVNAMAANAIVATDMQSLDILMTSADPTVRALNRVVARQWMDDVVVRTGSSVGRVITGGMRDTEVLLGFAGGAAFGAQPGDFNGASLGLVRVRGVRGEPYAMIDSNIVASDLGVAVLRGIDTDNNGEQFGLVGGGARRLVVFTDSGRYVWTNAAQPLPQEGDFTVMPVDNVI